MKNEIYLNGFSEVSEIEKLNVDGGVVTGTAAIVMGAIAIGSTAATMIVKLGKDLKWW